MNDEDKRRIQAAAERRQRRNAKHKAAKAGED